MLHLTLRQLRIFESVARNLSFSRAADELHLTQPAVSIQLKRLEESIGMPLFEQLGKRIFLTEAGRELYNHSRSINKQLTILEESLDSVRGFKHGKLKVAVVSSTATYLAPQLIARYSQSYPTVSVDLNIANRETVLNQLADNLIDLAIMGQPPEGAELAAAPFMKNPLVVIAPPDHPLTRQRCIPLAALEHETFLVREPGSGTRLAMERFFAEHGISLRPGMEINSNEAVKYAVHARLGIAIVSLHSIMPELETLRLKVLDVEKFPIVRHWYIAHREKKQLSAAAKAFRDFLLSEAAQITDVSGMVR
jgi:DNA-binding transcriptional LysR family regulator